jgi:hypothetical protein
MKKYTSRFDFPFYQFISLIFNLITKALNGTNILAEIEITKAMLLNSFLFQFWDEMEFFWSAFNFQLLSFFKPLSGIVLWTSIILSATLLYSIASILLLKQVSRKISNLVLVMSELNKKDVSGYLQQIQRFADLLGNYKSNGQAFGIEPINFSSDEEHDQKFDKNIARESKELRNRQSFESQGVSRLIRLTQSQGSSSKFQQENQNRPRYNVAAFGLYYRRTSFCLHVFDRFCQQLEPNQSPLQFYTQ